MVILNLYAAHTPQHCDCRNSRNQIQSDAAFLHPHAIDHRCRRDVISMVRDAGSQTDHVVASIETRACNQEQRDMNVW